MVNAVVMTDYELECEIEACAAYLTVLRKVAQSPRIAKLIVRAEKRAERAERELGRRSSTDNL